MTTTKTYTDTDEMELALDAVDAMAAYWQRRKSEFLDAAGDEFAVCVDPACWHEPAPDQRRIELVNVAFTEWLLFERPTIGAATPLEEFCAAKPVAMPERGWRALGEVAATQFFSRFAILGKDGVSGVCKLEDVRSGLRYDAWDPRLCSVERWLDGTIGERVARVGGAWLAVGQVRLYDRAPAESSAVDGPGEVHPEDAEGMPERMRQSFFLRLCRDVIGYRGRYSETARIRETA